MHTEDARKNVCIIIFAEHWQSLQKLSRSADGSDKLSNFLRYSFPFLSSSILEWRRSKLGRALSSASAMARLPNLVTLI